MKNKTAFLIVLLLLLLSFSSSIAAIVDTGTPSGSTNWQLAKNQNIAGQFVLTQSYSISLVQGYMGYNLGPGMNMLPGNVTLRILGDSGDLPDITKALYTTSFIVSGFSGYQWCGPSAPALVLDPGTYWAVFGAPGDTFFGYMLDGASGQLHYADIYNYQNGTTTVSAFDFNTGLRIDGSPVASPEPATLLLFGLGLAGLAGVRRLKS